MKYQSLKVMKYAEEVRIDSHHKGYESLKKE